MPDEKPMMATPPAPGAPCEPNPACEPNRLDESSARPASLSELYWAFNRLSLQGFGGVLAVAQRELVERLGWLDRDQFVEMFSLSQVLPGPNIVNLSMMIGDRFFGTRGAMTALAGLLLLPSIIVLALTATYVQLADIPIVASALRSMGAVAAGLITGTALKLMLTLRRNPLGVPISGAVAAATFGAIALLRWPLAWVVLGIGSISIAIAWYKLRSSTARAS